MNRKQRRAEAKRKRQEIKKVRKAVRISKKVKNVPFTGKLPTVNPDIHPYMVFCDGIYPKDRAERSLQLTGEMPPMYPTYHYTKTFERAEEIAEKIKPWGTDVLICRIEKVVQ